MLRLKDENGVYGFQFSMTLTPERSSIKILIKRTFFVTLFVTIYI